MRENSVFEYVNMPLPIIYFLILYCFTEKYYIDKSYIGIKDNQDLFGEKIALRIPLVNYILY